MIYDSTKKRQVIRVVLTLIFLAFFVDEFSAQNLKQEPVHFQNGEVQLSGTLFFPNSRENVPAVVILHGSGPDEGLEYHIYAEEFAKAGIATLVFDKRGSGKSGGDWRKRPFELMAADALAAVRYLQNRSEINRNKVGLWSISQGGWTAANAAARSRDVAFVISVAGNAVSPTQQEIWHKDQMYRAVNYSENARDTARKFWLMVFDWLILVDEGKFPLPDGMLESERSGVSTGMNYDPLPDWEKVTQPVLLIHGEYDKLTPANESISRISQVLGKNGNANLTYKIFPKSSHTITTNKTGLEFDWDEHFAPGYLKFTTDWILADKKPIGDSAILQPSAEFEDSGRFGKVTWYGRAFPQLIAMTLFPVIFGVGIVISIVSVVRHKSSVAAFAGLVCLVNFLQVIGFFIFLAVSVFPQGMNLMQSYSIPFWQKLLPLFGTLSMMCLITLLISIVTNRLSLKKWQIFIGATAMVFVPWLYYWNLIGVNF